MIRGASRGRRGVSLRLLAGAVLLCLAYPVSPGGAAEEALVREAVERSLPLLQSSSELTVAKRSNCFTCHHTGLAVMTFATARERGWPVDEDYLAAQLRFTAEILESNADAYRAGRGPGGQAFGAGSALWTLRLGGWEPDDATATVVDYLLDHRSERDYWAPPSIRPPSEESPFSATFVVLEGLAAYGATGEPALLENRVERARQWLRRTPAATTEDRVFRLLALHSAGLEGGEFAAAAAELRESQREDGGWGQIEGMDSDAYATGTALVALRRTGAAGRADAAFRRGIAWLLADQLPDGSWRVESRARPFQTYFESGYPHGTDQFLSITAACWATTALLLALPPEEGAGAAAGGP